MTKVIKLNPDMNKRTQTDVSGKIVDMNSKKPDPPQTGGNLSGQIDLNLTTAMVCAECGSEVFVEASMFRKVSKLLTGAPQDMVIPIPAFLCASCGALFKELLPEQLK